MDLKELKKNYAVLQNKYKLPSFEEINDNFEIEKIRKGEETLLRTIRKTMMEKIVNSLGFIEFLINPMNAPRVYMVYIKSMTMEDKREIDKIYSSLSELVLSSLKSEIDYSEKDEAKLIEKIFKGWESIKPSFRKIIANMEKPASTVAKEKTYFG